MTRQLESGIKFRFPSYQEGFPKNINKRLEEITVPRGYHFENMDAKKYFDWQERQREREDLTPKSLEALDKVRRDSRKLERQQVGSNEFCRSWCD